jgi:protease-4
MSLLRFLAKLFFWLLALIGALSLTAIVAAIVLALNFERPKKPIEDGTILTLDLAQDIPETDRAPWLEPWRKSLTMPELVLALGAAGKDPRINGLMLRMGGAAPDMARAQELRGAIKDFKDGGKKVHAFAESFGEAGNGTVAYYVASVADRIFLQPSGEVGLLGFRLEMPFVRGALDWLGIQPRVSQRREYKSVPAILTETSMPDPIRRNLQRLADSWLEQLVGDIAADRKVTPAQARSWVDRAPWGAPEATKAGLVDALSYWDEAKTSLGEERRMASVADYLAAMPDPPANAPRIALISAIGPVVLGAARKGPFGEEEIIASKDVSETIAKATDDKVAAIILRIDSPGGSYVAADQIWREVDRARRAGVPVVVSMIGTAASGGYFIAASAGTIVAQPGTITGSIGVFAGKPVLTGLWAKLGIAVEGVSAGAAADTDSMNADFSAQTWTRLEARTDAIYADFVDKVAKGRGLTPDRAEAAAKGQVWTGADAREMGLVDELGGFQVALDLALEAAKLPKDKPIRLVPYPTPESPLKRILDLFDEAAEVDGQATMTAILGDALFGENEIPRALAEELVAGSLRMPPIIVNGH